MFQAIFVKRATKSLAFFLQYLSDFFLFLFYRKILYDEVFPLDSWSLMMIIESWFLGCPLVIPIIWLFYRDNCLNCLLCSKFWAGFIFFVWECFKGYIETVVSSFRRNIVHYPTRLQVLSALLCLLEHWMLLETFLRSPWVLVFVWTVFIFHNLRFDHLKSYRDNII